MGNFLINILKFCLFGILLLAIIISLYFVYDPFKVLYSYNDYSYPYVIPNRDNISTNMFLKNYEKYKYNSFIFGSSRSLAFNPVEWKKYLGADDTPFMFDASGEAIFGIYSKIKFLDENGYKIDNALIIICRDATFKYSKNQTGHLAISHPLTSNDSWINYHFTFLKAYLNPDFLYNYYLYMITNKYQNSMSGFIEIREMAFDTVSNQIKLIDQDRELNKEPEAFYSKRSKMFYPRYGEKTDSIPRINEVHKKMLLDIQRILENQNTNYKIIISPLYEQLRLNEADLEVLNSIFSDHMYDFSGENNFTSDIRNYYEPSHYRTSVGDSIMKYVYSYSNETVPRIHHDAVR